MNNTLFKKINIFLKVNEETIDGYFNVNDPAPNYKRQLNQEFEEYIMNHAPGIKRDTIVTYKLNCVKASDTAYIDPLVHAIRRHFSLKKSIKEAEFKTFKRRNYVLLLVSLIAIVVFHLLMPMLFGHGEFAAFGNALDVFSYFICWKPIERLLFNWNPFLKDIALFKKLINAPAVLVTDEKEKEKMKVGYAV